MGGWFDKLTMSGFCYWRRFGAGPEQGNRPLTRATQPKQPSFRRKPESRKSPGKEWAGYKGFWIPAFAGTTVAYATVTLGIVVRQAHHERTLL